MVWGIVKKVVMFFPNKVIAINKNVDTLINLPDKTFSFISKTIGAVTGSAGAAKGSVDFIEAVGVAADGLQICASFIAGPNVTTIVTMPVSDFNDLIKIIVHKNLSYYFVQ